jgi:hypothetical protein
MFSVFRKFFDWRAKIKKLLLMARLSIKPGPARILSDNVEPCPNTFYSSILFKRVLPHKLLIFFLESL